MTNHTNPTATLTEADVLNTVTKTVNEFIRRAAIVGPEAAMEEAAEFHPGAAILIANFLSFAAEAATA